MPEFREATNIQSVLTRMADCVIAELASSGLPEAKVTIQPGATPVLDYVGNGGNCGELIVSVPSSFPTESFPTPAERPTCVNELAYVVEVAIFRCVPTGKKVGSSFIPPSPEQVFESTRLHLADMQAAHRAIRCCLGGKNQYVLGAWAPYGPEGGVAGGVWTVTVGGAV